MIWGAEADCGICINYEVAKWTKTLPLSLSKHSAKKVLSNPYG